MDIVFFIGKVFFGGYFVYNGVSHLTNLKASTGYAISKGVPMAKFGVIVSGLMIILGGGSVLANFHMKLGLILIGAFLVVITFMMHQFWKEKDPMGKMTEKIQFTKNLALLGATLMFLGM
jgi:uncharacterized membrane protein YphA (DoxX/SURF4 family)